MSVYWNAQTRALSPYVPGEQPRDRKYIKLNTNENPYPPSPKTLAAITAANAESLRLYPDPTALELRKAIAARYGTTVERVFVGNGSDEVLAIAFGALFERSGAPGALPVLFPDITYSFYPVYADLWGIPVEKPALTDDFSIRVADYLRPSGGVAFANPNAPTGLALSRYDVLEIVEYQGKANRVVLVDEAYVEFGAQSVVPDVADHPNLLTVHTMSKCRSLAGLRVGYAIGQEELIEGLCRVRDCFNSYTLDRCALGGAAVAVGDLEYYDEVNRRVRITRDRTAAALTKLGFRGPPSTANFLFVSHPRVRGEALFKGLRERGILVRHFNKPRIDQYLRISIGTDQEMDALVAACGEIVG